MTFLITVLELDYEIKSMIKQHLELYKKQYLQSSTSIVSTSSDFVAVPLVVNWVMYIGRKLDMVRARHANNITNTQIPVRPAAQWWFQIFENVVKCKTVSGEVSATIVTLLISKVSIPSG